MHPATDLVQLALLARRRPSEIVRACVLATFSFSAHKDSCSSSLRERVRLRCRERRNLAADGRGGRAAAERNNVRARRLLSSRALPFEPQVGLLLASVPSQPRPLRMSTCTLSPPDSPRPRPRPTFAPLDRPSLASTGPARARGQRCWDAEGGRSARSRPCRPVGQGAGPLPSCGSKPPAHLARRRSRSLLPP